MRRRRVQRGGGRLVQRSCGGSQRAGPRRRTGRRRVAAPAAAAAIGSGRCRRHLRRRRFRLLLLLLLALERLDARPRVGKARQAALPVGLESQRARFELVQLRRQRELLCAQPVLRLREGRKRRARRLGEPHLRLGGRALLLQRVQRRVQEGAALEQRAQRGVVRHTALRQRDRRAQRGLGHTRGCRESGGAAAAGGGGVGRVHARHNGVRAQRLELCEVHKQGRRRRRQHRGRGAETARRCVGGGGVMGGRVGT